MKYSYVCVSVTVDPHNEYVTEREGAVAPGHGKSDHFNDRLRQKVRRDIVKPFYMLRSYTYAVGSISRKDIFAAF